MFRWVDRSVRLSRLIERISTLVARQRGLPVVLGILLVVIGFVVQVVNVYVGSRFLELLGIILNSMGISIALISLLLAEPLGK